MIKRLLAAFAAMIILCVSVSAQDNTRKQQRQRWFNEMQQYKKEYIAKELKLTPEQSDKFFPVYDQMQSEIDAVARQTRKLSHDVEKKADNATDLEYEKAAEAAYELKGKEAAIEMKYFPQFKQVLTPRQLFRLKKAENDFMREIMKHRKDQKRQPTQDKTNKKK